MKRTAHHLQKKTETAPQGARRSEQNKKKQQEQEPTMKKKERRRDRRMGPVTNKRQIPHRTRTKQQVRRVTETDA